MRVNLEDAPERLAEKLAQGSVGKPHLMAVAGICLSAAGGPAWAPKLGAEALGSAWESDPLDGVLAAKVDELGRGTGVYSGGWLKSVRAAAGLWKAPENLQQYLELVAERDHEQTRRHIDRRLEENPGHLFWTQQAIRIGLYEKDLDWVLAGIDGLPSGLGPGITDKLRGDVYFIRGDYGTSAECYERSHRQGGFFVSGERLAESLYRSGERGRAFGLWKELAAKDGWRTNLILTLYERVAGLDRETRVLPGKCAVLLYTYNKRQDLEVCLESLFESDLGSSRVFVLDNGSSDATPELLEAWKDRVGERMRVVRAPVNVGAPAARNWLMRSREMGEFEFIAFLDDDAVVPGDWLGRLAAAEHRYPGAGVWGCRVADYQNPSVIQCADLHLCDPAMEPKGAGSAEGGADIGLYALYNQDMDHGQFDYVRPCVSVTGCCHLFRRDRLLECGDFDLKFSPSQFDDLDHDLRLCRMGAFPVYQGGLKVLHRKRSGKTARKDRLGQAQAAANMHQLGALHPPEELAGIRREEVALLKSDLKRKIRFLTEKGFMAGS